MIDSNNDALTMKKRIPNARLSMFSAVAVASCVQVLWLTNCLQLANAFSVPLSSTMINPSPQKVSNSKYQQSLSFFKTMKEKPPTTETTGADQYNKSFQTNEKTTITTTRATDMTNAEKISLNVMAVGVTTAVVSIVADPSLQWKESYFQDVTTVVLDATMPEGTADVVCIVLAESAAGIVAAIISLLVNSLLLPKKQRHYPVGTAVANGDFFIAQASAGPVLSSLGVSPVAATVVAVAVAAVPAGIVKATFTQKEMEKQELQHEQLERRRRKIDLSLGLLNYIPQKKRQDELEKEIAETNAKDSLVVEVVFDVIKWLVYAVLCTELEGKITVDGMAPFPGLESAVFGAISTLAAKVYSDILYAYFGFGGILKQKEIRSRTPLEWLCTYTKEAISGATLFGVYELMQIPCKAFVSALLTGGVEGCADPMNVQDVQACLAAYAQVNPPTAGPEAEFRSLVTALLSLSHQLPFFGN